MESAFASYVIIAWVVLALAAFPSFTPRRGMIVILLTGILFLPQVGSGAIELGPIKFTNANAICYAMLLAALLYDAERLFALTPSLTDLPALIWCVCPLVSTLLNEPPPDGSGVLRDAGSQTLAQATTYLIPYLIGRAYFSDLEGIGELAAGTVIAALVYTPLCLYEIRMSPQLQANLYGLRGFSGLRFGGYRPLVFMPNELVLAIFMAMATVLAAWTRVTGPATGRWRRLAVWILAPTLVLGKCVGSIVLASVGLGMLWLARTSAMRAGLLVLAAVPPVYCVARSTGAWAGNELVELSNDNINEDRAQSLNFRLEQENQLIAKALERPAFGWGGWGRNRIRNERGIDISITDGMWIIFMGNYGIVGLTAYWAMVLLPVIRFAWLAPAGAWTSQLYTAASGCAVAVGLWCVDSLPNAAVIPLFVVVAGGLARMNLTDQSDAQHDKKARAFGSQ